MATRIQAAEKRVRNDFGKFIHLSQDAEGEELIDIKVHNPLRRLYAFLDYLKTHGELKIAFRFTVPLVAVVTLALVAIGITGFSTLNRLASVCPTQNATRIGRLYRLTVEEGSSKPLSLFGIVLVPAAAPKLNTQTVLRDGSETFTLTLPQNLDSTVFHEQTVAATGDFNPCSHTLAITSTRNLTLLSP